MTWWVGAPAALPEDWGLLPRTHMVAPVPGEFIVLWLLRIPGMHVVHLHTRGQEANTRRIKINLKKRFLLFPRY